MREWLWSGGILFIIIGIPALLYYAIRKFLKPENVRIAANIIGGSGLAIAVCLAGIAFNAQITHPGQLAIMILIPLGGLLALVSFVILYFANRKSP